MYCAKMCRSCADACAAGSMDMVQCIRALPRLRGRLRRGRQASAFAGRASNDAVVRETLELCARACDACAAECEKHDHEHCKLCAQMCRECAEDCRNATMAVGVVA